MDFHVKNIWKMVVVYQFLQIMMDNFVYLRTTSKKFSDN